MLSLLTIMGFGWDNIAFIRSSPLITPPPRLSFTFLYSFIEFVLVNSSRQYGQFYLYVENYLLLLEPTDQTLPVEDVSAVGYFDALFRFDRAQADYAVLHFQSGLWRAFVELDVRGFG
jgi:hypothetical protein